MRGVPFGASLFVSGENVKTEICNVVNELSKEIKLMEIVLFFDLHIGSPKCRYDLIMSDIEYVKTHENAYAIIGGDIINNSIKASVGDVYEEQLSPMQQIKKAVTMFEPIKDKILCATSGNHEARSYKQDGIDLLYFFCAELGITEKYDAIGLVCSVKFGWDTYTHKKIRYNIYVSHGTGNGGRTIGGKANGLERRSSVIINCDVYINGHTHTEIIFRDSVFYFDPYNNQICQKDRLFVNASSPLGYEAYAQTFGLKPSSTFSPRIYLDGTKKLATAIG